MKNKIPNKEWELAESVANDIRGNIHTHYMENAISSNSTYVKAEVFVPMTENINTTFEIDVPYEMMDESNSELLKYFKEKIYPSFTGEYLTEAKELCSGVFWIITESRDLADWKLLMFDIPCDTEGNVIKESAVMLNAKNGRTYNHKKLWETEIKNKTSHKPYNKMEYNYYPRGRVDISNNRATIYLNPHINVPAIINEIKQKFGLIDRNISKVRVFPDGSEHYQCFID